MVTAEAGRILLALDDTPTGRYCHSCMSARWPALASALAAASRTVPSSPTWLPPWTPTATACAPRLVPESSHRKVPLNVTWKPTGAVW